MKQGGQSGASWFGWPGGESRRRATVSQAKYTPVKDDAMATAARRFKVYYGPESETTTAGTHQAASQTVTVSLGEVLPLLADAVNSRRTWLKDFANDEITISADLYEVILAYQHHIRPSA
ncbi:MAG TPA: hypothetical protein VFE46_02430 [Pirellulales bacterium]|nr:hypothetical protein [Pirellulales bacterium]